MESPGDSSSELGSIQYRYVHVCQCSTQRGTLCLQILVHVYVLEFGYSYVDVYRYCNRWHGPVSRSMLLQFHEVIMAFCNGPVRPILFFKKNGIRKYMGTTTPGYRYRYCNCIYCSRFGQDISIAGCTIHNSMLLEYRTRVRQSYRYCNTGISILQ